MKLKLTALLAFIVLLCSCKSPNSHQSTVVITMLGGQKDTLTIQYYKALDLDGDYLMDENAHTFAKGVISFSMLNTQTLK